MTKCLSVAVPVAVAVVAGGIAFGAYFATQAMDGTSLAGEAEQPAATTAAAGSSPAPALTPQPTAPPTSPEPTWGPLGCADCLVKGGQTLRVTADDIELGPDGKYYVADRGDGCAYREDRRAVWELGTEEVILRAPGCEVFWIYLPATREVRGVIP
jgi:hypothetical protein